jgi:hypothetical protein
MDNVTQMVRAALGYKDKAPTCATCAHHEAVEDPHLDRSTIHRCVRNVDFQICVSSGGVCRNHTSQETPHA